MGHTYSKNIINASVDLMTKVGIKTLQECQAKVTLEEFLNISNSHGITLNDVTFSESVFFHEDCTTNDTINTRIKNNIKEVVSQIAKAISQSLDLNPGSTDSKNVTNIMNKIGIKVSESFIQNCKENITEGQTLNISDASEIVLINVNFKESINETINCVQKVIDKNYFANKLDLKVLQKATSKVKGLLGALGFIIVVIIVIIASFILLGEKALFSPKFWIVMIIVVIFYLTLAYFFKLWPFNKSAAHSDQTSDIFFQ